MIDVVAELRALRTQAGGALMNEISSLIARIEGEARVAPPAPLGAAPESADTAALRAKLDAEAAAKTPQPGP